MAGRRPLILKVSTGGAQALAAQGYAVLQPNFRGSIVDSSFLEAGFGEWGRKMQTDLSDGVRYLAHEDSRDCRPVLKAPWC
jgi:dipeptidyl aminopeptidase/acylaminoacyl peptidase